MTPERAAGPGRNPDDVAAFRDAARHCTAVMMEAATYIRRELPSLETSAPHRTAIDAVCDVFTANWFDISTELTEMAEFRLPDEAAKVAARVERIHRWLGEDLPRLHELVSTLAAAADAETRFRAVEVLVTESAANVLRAYAAVTIARDRCLGPHAP